MTLRRESLARFQSLLALVVMVAAMSVLSDKFLTADNGWNILRQNSANLCLSIGMTLVILAGGIDLSVGAVLALSAAVAAELLKNGFALPVLGIKLELTTSGAVWIALLVGAGLGGVNGMAVTRLGVPPFVVTLGMLSAARGLTMLLTNGKPITGLGSGFGLIGNGQFLGAPIPVWIAVGLIVLFVVVTRKTRFGRYVYAIGGNERAARLSGLPVVPVKQLAYTLCGALAGVAGLIVTSRLDSAQPNAGLGYELDSIAAVVIGGTSLSGGRGSIFGTVLGCLIIGVLNNGLFLLDVSPFWQQVVKGLVIVAAVAVDRQNLKAERGELFEGVAMASDRIVATYLIETPGSPEQAAQVLAGEQSTGTFVAVPGETAELKERYAARIERVTPLGETDRPGLPGAKASSVYKRAELVVSFPLETVGTNLPVLLSTVLGNLSELREFSGLRLLDIEVPDELAAAQPGPQFGVEGTRRMAGVEGRPVIGTIVKPSVGLTPAQTAALARQLAESGIDFIKDDELMADPPHSPLAERVAAVMRELNEVADKTGKKVMYAVNISGGIDHMKRSHDTVLRHGGTCVMVSVNHVGLAGVMELRKSCALPIHGHRNGWGMLTRCPALGMEFTAYQKIWRMAGVDQLHVNGIRNKFWEPDESVVRSMKACLTPLNGTRPVMPVVSSGQWGGQAPDTYKHCPTVDLMYLAGGGIIAHPGGAAAGCRAIRQAWEAAVGGVPLDEYARTRPELRQALDAFGKR
jgi:ribulose-bisphosphate carboxylase large chain